MSMSPLKGSAYRVITTIVLLVLLVVLVVIVILRNYSATLFSGGNLPNDTFLSTSSDSVYVVPVNLYPSNRFPITIQQIQVTDVDTNTELSPDIYVADLEQDLLLETTGYTTVSEFQTSYSNRNSPLVYAENGLLPLENQHFQSKSICIFLLFDEFPQSDQSIAVTCQYKLFNMISMTCDTLLRRD